MKKLLSVLLVLAMVVSCVAVMQMTTFAASEETVLEVNFDDKNTNPDIYVGSTPSYCETVTDDAAHGKVLEFKTDKSWVSPCWDIGLKIKEFADKNSGKIIILTVSAEVKLDNAKMATIRFRNNHGNDKILGVYDMKRNYDNVENGKWITLSSTSTIMAADIATLTNNTDIGTSLDNLKPLDSSKPVTAKVDNYKVTIKAVEKPIGYEYEVIETNTDQMGPVIYNSAWNSDLSFLKSEIKDGKVTLNYTVYNMSDVDIQFQPMIQVGWQFIKNDGKAANPEYDVKAKTSAKITFTFDMSADGKVTNGAGEQVDLTKATLRFDFTNTDGTAGIPAGAKFAIIPENEKLVDYMSALSGVAVVATPIGEAPVLPTPGEDETPTPGEDATPTPTPKRATGVKVTFNDDVTFADPSAMFFITDTNGGIASAADIKNNQITKTFKIKNHGEETIGVVVRLQATVKKSDGVTDTWAGNPDNNDMVEIEPGKVGTVTITVPVKDGKVTILEQEVPVEKLFARFDVTGEGGACELSKGTSFTIFCDEEVAVALTRLWVSNSDKLTRELSYESLDSNSSSNGDLLPVAFIAVAVVATAALVVVSRKKREEF